MLGKENEINGVNPSSVIRSGITNEEVVDSSLGEDISTAIAAGQPALTTRGGAAVTEQQDLPTAAQDTDSTNAASVGSKEQASTRDAVDEDGAGEASSSASSRKIEDGPKLDARDDEHGPSTGKGGQDSKKKRAVTTDKSEEAKSSSSDKKQRADDICGQDGSQEKDK